MQKRPYQCHTKNEIKAAAGVAKRIGWWIRYQALKRGKRVYRIGKFNEWLLQMWHAAENNIPFSQEDEEIISFCLKCSQIRRQVDEHGLDGVLRLCYEFPLYRNFYVRK
jgi:hypothetical protein